MTEAIDSLKNIVVSDFNYFKDWYGFNFKIEENLSERQLEEVFNVCRRDIFDILSKSECSKTMLRKNLLSILGLSNIVNYDIAGEVVRLAITNKELIKSAMIISGAIFWHQEIAKIISKKELTVLQNFIGENTYSFVVKRGMMLWKMVPPLERIFSKTETLAKQIRETGKAILCRALFGIPDEIKKRFELVFDEKFDIPKECDEVLFKKCFALIKFSLERVSMDKVKHEE
ncbi:MAG: SctK family type III secretion system sorting platform protein [Puniceicoccales bacterium]|jgi:hypothetical protein|nr:SctK family type III secretion system sorting platform protein [Puniceicoccales bacterium]